MKAAMESPAGAQVDLKSPLDLALKSVPSTLNTAGGKTIHFTRAILVIKNTGLEPVPGFIPQAALTQEGGMAHDITEVLTGGLRELYLSPGATIQWDLFDLLAAGHPGVASKVHLFGYKAVLNWWFDLIVRADYRTREDASPLQTPPFRARFRWNAQPGALDEVALSIELQ